MEWNSCHHCAGMSWPIVSRCAAPPVPGALAVSAGTGVGVYGCDVSATCGGAGVSKSGPTAQPAQGQRDGEGPRRGAPRRRTIDVRTVAHALLREGLVVVGCGLIAARRNDGRAVPFCAR